MQKRVQVIATDPATLSTPITAEICQVSYNCVTKYVELFQQNATLRQIVRNNNLCIQGKLCDRRRPTLNFLQDSTPQFIFEN